MQRQIAVVTVGVADLARSRHFYTRGFGWEPVFANEEIIFYDMNQLMFGTFIEQAMQAELCRPSFKRPAALAMTHIVSEREQVQIVIDKLSAAGGLILRNADEPHYGGFRGYVTDPDDNTWEIAWNASWKADEQGSLIFGI